MELLPRIIKKGNKYSIIFWIDYEKECILCDEPKEENECPNCKKPYDFFKKDWVI